MNTSANERMRADFEAVYKLPTYLRFDGKKYMPVPLAANEDTMEIAEVFNIRFQAWQAALQSQAPEGKPEGVNGTTPAEQEGWKLVPVESIKNIYMLIDPPPVEADGKLMVFKNPKAAETLTKISAEIRAMLAAAPHPTPAARAKARYCWPKPFGIKRGGGGVETRYDARL